MTRRAWVAVLTALVSSGCALAPGMVVDEDAASARGRAASRAEPVVEPITPAIVSRLVRQRTAGPRERAPAEPAGGAYTVAPHDVLQVTVWDHPELTVPTGQFRSPEENGNPVLADGTMFYPHVGVLPVAGRTVAEIRRLLTDRLESVIKSPQLDVRVAAFRGKRVQVAGEVVQPIPVAITDVPLTVQDAIAAAHGFSPEADPSGVTLTRAGRVHHLDLQALYEEGDLSQNWVLRDGDVLHVPDRNPNRVFVLGEVRRQQAKLMVKRRMTLAEAIGDADGIDPSTANVARIYVIRGDFAAPSIFRLDAGSADALLLATQFPLEPRDVVFVATYELARWNRVLNLLLPTVQTLYQAAITYDVARRR
ncbi:MAG: polysaccharide export protein [Anaeromyxobacteraceae bacterium]